MKKATNIIIGLGVAVAVILSVVSYVKTPEKVIGVQGPRGEQGIQGPKGESIVGPRGQDGVDAPVKFGSVTGPDLYSPYQSINGVLKWYPRSGLTQASSTACSLKAPASTSTLESASITFRVASSTQPAYVQVIHTVAAGMATTATNLIGTVYNVAAGAQASYVASTTQDARDVYAPNEYVNFKMQDLPGGIAATGNVPTGFCEAVFRQF